MDNKQYLCEYCNTKRLDIDDISQPSSNRDKIIIQIKHYGYYFCKDCKSLLHSDISEENSSVDIREKAKRYIDTIQNFLEEENKSLEKVIPQKTEYDKELWQFASEFYYVKSEIIPLIENDGNIYDNHFGDLIYKLLELNEQYNTFVKEEKHV